MVYFVVFGFAGESKRAIGFRVYYPASFNLYALISIRALPGLHYDLRECVIEFQFNRHTARCRTRSLSVCHNEITLVFATFRKADMRF